MRKIIFVFISGFVLCNAGYGRTAPLDSNIEEIKKVACQLETESKNFYASGSANFFISGSYINLITKLGKYPDTDLKKARDTHATIIMKEYIDIAADREKKPAVYEAVAKYFNAPPPHARRPVVWAARFIHVSPEHLNSEYRLAWEERLLCPYIGKDYFMESRHAVDRALYSLQEIQDEKIIDFFAGLYGLSCGINSRKAKNLGDAMWNEIYKLKMKNPRGAYHALFLCYTSCQEPHIQQLIIKNTCPDAFRPIIAEEINQADPNTEYGRFLRLCAQEKCETKQK